MNLTVDSYDVVVVGAGPVGLALASLLRRADVRCLVVERQAQRDQRTKAITVHAPTLEFLQSLGLLDDILLRGVKMETISFHIRDGGSFHGRMTGMDSVVDGYVNIPQPSYEELLEHYALDNGASISSGVGYVSHQAGDDSGGIMVSLSGGRQTQVRCSYLVGCDGVGSTVREQLGIQMIGRHVPSSYLLAEGKPAERIDVPETGIYVANSGMATLLPLPGGLVRIAGPVATGLILDQDERVTIDSFARTVDNLGFGDRLRLAEVARTAHYVVQERIAERFVDGSVVLAGDAAHLNAPAGGQGLNLGIADAVALAWRLVLALRQDNVGFLAGYDSERRAAAEEGIATSNVFPLVQRMRTAVTAVQYEQVQHDLDGHAVRWSQLYPNTDAQKHNRSTDRLAYQLTEGARVPTVVRSAGTAAPDFPLLPVDLSIDRSTILLLGSSDHHAVEAKLAAIRAESDRLTDGLGIPKVGEIRVVHAPAEILAARSLWSRDTTALLVRPDRRVAAVIGPDVGNDHAYPANGDSHPELPTPPPRR